MTTEHHPITPSPGLIDKWRQEYTTNYSLARQAARWGADQELEACCANLRMAFGEARADWLRSGRRPKPPSLAEQALEVVTSLRLGECVHRNGAEMDVLTAALERLQELEDTNG